MARWTRRRLRRRNRARRKVGYSTLMRKVLRTRQGRKALQRWRRFWGLRGDPPSIKRVELPGPKNKEIVLVGMGKSPALNLSQGPKHRPGRIVRKRHRAIVATDPSGRRIFILRGRNSNQRRQRLRYLGHVPSTEYIPGKGVERAGSPKKGKHWIHKMGEEGGTWPKAYQDQAGNIVYGKGTYRVGKWIVN